jgi:hemerythrin superfamily protein
MTNIDLGRPIEGDVVDLILDDHRRFEALLRDLRDSSQDRDAVRHAFATLHVAHAEAEEKHVYPKLKRKNAVDDDEADHGVEERNAQIDADCGRIDNVRRIVAEARRKGLLDDEDDEDDED